ncbi:reverse transcriptase domain-containing protein [Tanacetum coccineum]
MHDGPRKVVFKAISAGYYWSSMPRDANNEIRISEACQVYATVPRLPKDDMISVTSAWSFQKWGMDIVDPLPKAPGRLKYLIVVVDYFTKWFGVPVVVITDNGTQLINEPFKLHQEGEGWVEELPNVLWAQRTMPKTSNGETSFSLAYGTEAVIPAEIGMPTRRTAQRVNEENDVELRLNLNLLEERIEIGMIREAM